MPSTCVVLSRVALLWLNARIPVVGCVSACPLESASHCNMRA